MSLINSLEAAKAKIERGILMTDLGAIARAAKRVTMDDIYVSLDSLKDQQSADFRHLSERIDNVSQRVDNMGGQVNQRIDQLNQRFDTVVQMLLDLSKQIMELSKQKN